MEQQGDPCSTITRELLDPDTMQMVSPFETSAQKQHLAQSEEWTLTQDTFNWVLLARTRCTEGKTCVRTQLLISSRTDNGLPLCLCPCVLLTLNCPCYVPLPPLPREIFNLDIVLVGCCLGGTLSYPTQNPQKFSTWTLSQWDIIQVTHTQHTHTHTHTHTHRHTHTI